MDSEDCGHCDGPHTPGRGFVSADPKADERARPTILLIDDEKLSRSSLRSYIEADVEGLSDSRVLEAESFEEALDVLSKETVHVIVLDKNLGPDANDPRHNGLSLIPEALSLRPHTQILMLTGSDDVQDVVRAIQSGACGFLQKGSKPDLIVSQIQKAMQTARMSIDNARRERGVTPSTCRIEVPGKSIAMRKLSAQLQAVAESDRPVLLLGETGVGKTTIARLIHKYRRNCLEISDRPFVELNLSALNSGTLERELFGNEKGAYTDAKRMHEGLLEVADHGTLFIDEIGDISLDIQVKLLKAIEEKKFMRVGGDLHPVNAPTWV